VTKSLKLLGIFAHPDDEAFGTGGTFSKYAAQGVDVHLIIATCGESGQIADERLATPETLGQVRERELQNACRVFGINPPHLLRYPDGRLTIVNQKEAVSRIVKIIRLLKPQVVIGFGPDGIYGHYDHLACHRWTTIAARVAADSEWFPDQLAAGLEPHQVDKVYHRATAQRWLDAMGPDGRRDVMMDGVPFSFLGYPDEQITTCIDIRDYAAQKQQGILCHATQIKAGNQFTDATNLFDQPWFQFEAFVRAQSLVTVSDDVETDLFAGLAD